MRILPAASRLSVMWSARSSLNTDIRPALGEKLALIAILVLSRVCPPRRHVSAGSRTLRPESEDGLEAALRTAWIFSGDILNFFCASAPCALLSPRAQGPRRNRDVRAVPGFADFEIDTEGDPAVRWGQQRAIRLCRSHA